MSNHTPYSVSGPGCDSPAYIIISFIAILGSILLVGCGADTARAPIVTNPSSLVVSPASIDFGVTKFNSYPSTYPLILTNPGPYTVSVDSVSVLPAGIFSLRGFNGRVMLAAGRALRLQVGFSPRQIGAYAAALTIHSTEYVSPTPSLVSVSSKSSAAGPANTSGLSGGAIVALHGRASEISMSLSPVSVNLQSGQLQQFTSTVNDSSTSPVSWTAQYGTITSTGLYTAPMVTTPTQDTITATSVVYPNSYASAQVSVSPQTISSSPSVSVSVSVSPSSVTLSPNGVQQFTAAVSGGSNGVRWTAVLGSINTAGLYTAPQATSTTVDTVSAISVDDPSKYATATVTIAVTPVTSTPPPAYSLTSQQPVSVVPYGNNPGSITSKRLPSDVMNHLYTSPQGVSGHDIAVCTFTDCGNPAYSPGGASYGEFVTSSPGTSDRGAAFYYATDSDPWYKLTGCSLSSMNGLAFHAPNQAKLSASTDDNAISIWDQSSGMAVTLYTFGNPSAALPPSSCSGTGSSSCAVGVNFGNSYCQAQNFLNERDWGWKGIASPLGGGDSLMPGAQLSVFAGRVRQQELMAGQINHAITIVDDCHNSNNKLVFPGTSLVDPGLVCGAPNSGPNYPQRPPGGALLFLDYSDAEINSMNLPAWQKAYIVALSHYGAYVGVTGGTFGYVPFGGNGLESGQAWAYAGMSDPFWSWLGSQPGITRNTHADGSSAYIGYVFRNIPVIRGTDVLGHMYMADPCVVKTLAGVAGGC